MSTYGYLRNNKERSLMEQLRLFQKLQCQEIFIEGESIVEDHELGRLMTEFLHEGDTLVIDELRSFGKTTQELSAVFQIFQEQKIRLISVRDEFDTREKQDFYKILLLLGEIDALYQKETAARSAEKPLGQVGRPKISTDKVHQILYLYSKQQYSLRQIAIKCAVSVGSVHKYVKDHGVVSENYSS